MVIRIYDTRIIAILIGAIFGMIYLRAFENDFFRDIILVAIPSLLGLFGTKWITNRWQIQSTKIKMKKEILEKYTNSAVFYRNVLHQFVLKFLIAYGTHDSAAYDLEKGTSSFKISFPKYQSEKPKEKLKDEIKRMQEDIDLSRRTHEPQMMALLRLYYRDESLVTEYIEILKHLGLVKNYVYEILDDKTTEQLLVLAEKYYSAFGSISGRIKDFNKVLVERDIQII